MQNEIFKEEANKKLLPLSAALWSVEAERKLILQHTSSQKNRTSIYYKKKFYKLLTRKI